MITIAFFNNKGGVGKTSLCYHLAWMLSELRTRVVVADLDPQANLTAMFVDEERLEELWPKSRHPQTIYGAVEPIVRGTGDLATAHVEPIGPRLGLVPGDLALAGFESNLSDAWPRCSDGMEAAFRTVSSFHRIIQSAGAAQGADVGLIDVGPNLGAINRSALLAADYVLVPLAADLFSIQGLRNLGPTLVRWRTEWRDRLPKCSPDSDIDLPKGTMAPMGYIVLQHAVRLDRPVKAYQKWMKRIPGVYREDILNDSSPGASSVDDDPNCLASLKNYRSLMPLAQDALKPMFHLKPADGALGGHMTAVQNCYHDFETLAREVARQAQLHVA